jgi:CheY-like chemotaxis protein
MKPPSGGRWSAVLDGDTWTFSQVAALAPDLLMLDVLLADQGAFELCRSLRADPRFAALPIIFFTPLRTDEQFRRYRSAGGSRFLNKVIDRRHLLQAVAEEIAAAKPLEAARAGQPSAAA